MISLGVTSIIIANDEKKLKQFADLPYRKYRDSSHWVPPLRSEASELLAETNPFFNHVKAKFFLAMRSGEAVGRIASFDDAAQNAKHHINALFFGFFEADNAETATLLFDALEREAKSLAHLTGWNINDIRRQMKSDGMKPAPEKPFWKRIWGD